MYRGWTQRDYQNKHYTINQKDEGTLDDRGRDGGTNFILIKEQETCLTFQEHDDDDEILMYIFRGKFLYLCFQIAKVKELNSIKQLHMI